MVFKIKLRAPRLHLGYFNFEKYVKRLKASFYSFDLKKDTFHVYHFLWTLFQYCLILKIVWYAIYTRKDLNLPSSVDLLKASFFWLRKSSDVCMSICKDSESIYEYLVYHVLHVACFSSTWVLYQDIRYTIMYIWVCSSTYTHWWW